VSHFYPPDGLGGGELHTQSFAEELTRRGYGVRVLAAGAWERGTEHRNGHRDSVERGIPVRRLDLNWRRASDPNRALYANPEVGRCFEAWLEEWRPDLVHVTSCYTLSAEVLEVAHRRSLPIVQHLFDFWFLCPKTVLLRGDGGLCDGRTTARQCLACLFHGHRALEWPRRVVGRRAAVELLALASRLRWVRRLRPLKGRALDVAERKRLLARALGKADQVIALCDASRRIFEEAGVEAPIEVIPSGCELGERHERRVSTVLRFAFLGLVQELKGAHVAVAAFLSAVFERPASLTLWGGPVEDNAYRDELVARAAGRSDVRFPGVIARQDLPRELASVDVLLVPSLCQDNNPRVIREAQHAGVPVVASNVGGIAESVRHGVDGLLFERGSIDALRRQIERLAHEPGLLETLRSNLPEVRTLTHEVDELEGVYQRLLAGPRSGAAALGLGA